MVGADVCAAAKKKCKISSPPATRGPKVPWGPPPRNVPGGDVSSFRWSCVPPWGRPQSIARLQGDAGHREGDTSPLAGVDEDDTCLAEYMGGGLGDGSTGHPVRVVVQVVAWINELTVLPTGDYDTSGISVMTTCRPYRVGHPDQWRRWKITARLKHDLYPRERGR